MSRENGKAKIRSILVAGVALGSLVLAGCSAGNPGAAPSSTKAKSSTIAPVTYPPGVPLAKEASASCTKSSKSVSDLKVTFIPPSSIYNYYLAIGKGMQSRAKELGVGYTMLAPATDDVSIQLGMIQDAVTSGADAIVLHTDGGDQAAAPLIKRAIAQGIDIVIVNSDIPDFPTPINAVVGYKERAGDTLVGKYAVKEAAGKQVNVGIIEGAPGYDTDQRVGGFKDGIAGASNFKVVASLNGKWDTVDGNTAATDLLQANPDVNMIFAANDYMALGAVQAAKALNRTDVVIYGSDGDPNAGLEQVAAGTLKATLDTSPYGMGRVAMQVAVDCLTGAFPGGMYVETPGVVVDQSSVNAILCKPQDLYPKPAKKYSC